MKQQSWLSSCLLVLMLILGHIGTNAQPSENAKTRPTPNDIDFSELDKLVPVELKERNTPVL